MRYMNSRERFVKTLMFGSPDKVPFMPGGGRESTLAAWRKQGLPEGMDPMAALLPPLLSEKFLGTAMRIWY